MKSPRRAPSNRPRVRHNHHLLRRRRGRRNPVLNRARCLNGYNIWRRGLVGPNRSTAPRPFIKRLTK